MGASCNTDSHDLPAGTGKAPNKLCPRCGTWFHCSHSGKCWCVEHQLSPAAMAQMEAAYSDCLCEACLSHYEKL